MNPEKYIAFTTQDFLADDYFIQWITHPTAGSNEWWHSFLQLHPQKKETIQSAATLIRQYRLQETFDNTEHKELLWRRIESSLVEQRVTGIRRKVFSLPALIRIAAAVLLVTGLSFWVMNRNASNKQYLFTTTFGEIKTITLPDHSQVILNGNSSVSYSGSWNKQAVREVWMKGEGYFIVNHLNKDTAIILPAERFVVHCGDVNIEVLGTTFNVKSRRGKTNVALITGKIRIDYANAATAVKPVIMAPGDYVVYNGESIVTNKKLPKPAQVTTWTANEISFTDATLKEITETLQDNYGYTVFVKDSSLLWQKIEGDISVNSVTDLLDVMATSLNIKIEQAAEKHITISK